MFIRFSAFEELIISTQVHLPKLLWTY